MWMHSETKGESSGLGAYCTNVGRFKYVLVDRFKPFRGFTLEVYKDSNLLDKIHGGYFIRSGIFHLMGDLNRQRKKKEGVLKKAEKVAQERRHIVGEKKMQHGLIEGLEELVESVSHRAEAREVPIPDGTEI